MQSSYITVFPSAVYLALASPTNSPDGMVRLNQLQRLRRIVGHSLERDSHALPCVLLSCVKLYQLCARACATALPLWELLERGQSSKEAHLRVDSRLQQILKIWRSLSSFRSFDETKKQF